MDTIARVLAHLFIDDLVLGDIAERVFSPECSPFCQHWRQRSWWEIPLAIRQRRAQLARHAERCNVCRR